MTENDLLSLAAVLVAALVALHKTLKHRAAQAAADRRATADQAKREVTS